MKNLVLWLFDCTLIYFLSFMVYLNVPNYIAINFQDRTLKDYTEAFLECPLFLSQRFNLNNIIYWLCTLFTPMTMDWSTTLDQHLWIKSLLPSCNISSDEVMLLQLVYHCFTFPSNYGYDIDCQNNYWTLRISCCSHIFRR